MVATIAQDQKWCNGCRETRPRHLFHSHNGRPDGLQDRCKHCTNAYNAQWRADHRLKVRLYNRQWAIANRESINARATRRRAATLEERRAYNRQWMANHPEVGRASSMRRRARTVSTDPFSNQQLAARMVYFGNKCWMCGGPFEHVDHVKPLSKGGPHMLANLRPACAECNLRKHAQWPVLLKEHK